MNHDTKRAAIGIDVGGTAIKAGLVRSNGEVLAKDSTPTQASKGVEHVVAAMCGLIDRFRKIAAEQDVACDAVGLGMPGTLSHQRGIVIAPPNLEGWRNVPIVELLHRASGLRVILDNDANNAALGEYFCGAGRGVLDMVMLTIGTGIGGGLILNGRLWRGERENAGEIGHTVVQFGGRRCQCGQLGCLEAYASGGATVERMCERIRGGEMSSLKEVLDQGETITTEMIVDAVAQGDRAAQLVWAETCRYLAVGCINIQHFLSPGRIVLAGGLSGAGARLYVPVIEAMEELSSNMLGERPDIQMAELGNDAGFIGSALSVFHRE